MHDTWNVLLVVLFLGVFLVPVAGLILAGQVAHRRLTRRGHRPVTSGCLVATVHLGAWYAVLGFIFLTDPSASSNLLVFLALPVAAAAVMTVLPFVVPRRQNERRCGRRVVRWPLRLLARLSYVGTPVVPIYVVVDAYGTDDFARVVWQAPWVGLFLFGLARYLLALDARVRAPTASEVVRQEPRAPILYLRAFASEVQPFHIARASEVAHLTKGFTTLLGPNRSFVKVRFEDYFDEAIVKHLGPFVAMGNPEDYLPPAGAARDYTPDSEWQHALLPLLTRAQAVLLEPGGSANLGWELRTVLEQGHANKLFVLTSPQRERRVVSVKWWKSVQRVIVRPTDYAARFTASMS